MYGYLLQYLSQPHKWLGQHFYGEPLKLPVSHWYKSGIACKAQNIFLPCVGELQCYKNINCAIFNGFKFRKLVLRLHVIIPHHYFCGEQELISTLFHSLSKGNICIFIRVPNLECSCILTKEGYLDKGWIPQILKVFLPWMST